MIFDTDDRVLVDYTQNNGEFVQLTSTFEDGTILVSSGVMIDANDVLTSAHNFYSQDHGGLATSVIVTPSRFNDYKPFGSTIADHFSTTQEWVDTSLEQYDYGVISLAAPIGYYTSWSSYGYLNDITTTADTQLVSYGYAQDISNGNYLIQTSGTPDKIQGDNILLFEDDLDTSEGQEGSAIIASENNQDIVVGILSDTDSSTQYNNVLALDAASVANIDKWVLENNDDLTPLKTTTYDFKDVQDISLLYIGLLGRQPDEAGLKYWADQLSREAEFYNIIGGFLDSDELQNGDDYTGDTKSFVTSLYINILNRQPDEAGLNYWVQELDSFSSKEKVISGFLESTEYRDANALNTYTIWHNWFESFDREVLGTNDAEIFQTTLGDDYIDAGAGDDIIDAKSGNDYIYGGVGSDTITSGEGKDFLIFDLSQDGIDIVTDFDIKNDKIHLLSDSSTLSTGNVDGADTLVLYEDENSYIVLNGLVKDDFADITFV